MPFEGLGKFSDVTSMIGTLGIQKSQETLSQINLLLRQLQDAGYEIGEMEAQLAVPPEITVHLKTGPTLTDGKLQAAFQANQDNKFVAAIIGSLVQANKLRDSVNIDTIELAGAKVVLKLPPSITLEWKSKEEGKAASA
jgi:hypothetical protein